MPVGEFPAASVEHLVTYYRDRYGLAIEWNYLVGFVLIVGAAFFIFHKW